MRPDSADRRSRRPRLFRPTVLVGTVIVAFLLVEFPGLAHGAAMSDQNRDGVVDLADLALFSQSELGQDWQTVDWCQWLASPHKHEKHLRDLLDFIDEHFRCDQEDPLAIRNPNDHPTRLAWSPDGQQIYVTDPRVGSVFIYDSTATPTGELRVLGKPLGIAVHPQGDIYVGNDEFDAVAVYSPDGFQTATIGAGILQMPNDLAFDQYGQLYVVDSQRNRVEVFNPVTGAHLRTIGGGQLRFPVALAISGEELFVANQANFEVKVFDLQGNPLRSFGGISTQGMIRFSWQGKFVRLQSLGIDSAGRLHALDSHMAIIQILNAANGSFIGSYGAKGSAAGELDLPLDIDLNQYGETAVANTRNERVELLTPP